MVFYLDEYEYKGKKLTAFEYCAEINRQFSDEETKIILRDKVLQEKQRAKYIMDNEKDPMKKERMKALYDSQDYGFDYLFYGKEPHKY